MRRAWTILVVEDTREIRDGLLEFFQSRGFAALVAGDGQEALSLIGARNDIGLMVLDLDLPIVDGYGVLDRKAEYPHGRDLPVIVFSGEPGCESLRGTHGVVEVFDKTAPLTDLLAVAEDLLRGATGAVV